MKKVVTIVLLVIVSVTFSVLRAESTEQITGGCQAQMGELSKEDEEKINELTELIGTGEDLKMIAELNTFLRQNPTNQSNARPKIQAILSSIVSKGEVSGSEFAIIELISGRGQPIAEQAGSVVDYYTEDHMYPDFSYEAVLSLEFMYLYFSQVWQAYFTELTTEQEDSELSTKTKFNLSLNAMELLGAQNSGMYGAMDKALGLFNTHPLDLCAKKQLWEFSERLIGGEKYYEKQGNGIESNEEFVTRLTTAYNEEQEQVIREIAERVMSKLKTAAEFVTE